jgi:hypothetical protein
LLNASEAEPARDGWGYPKLTNRVRNHKHGIFCVRFQTILRVVMLSPLFGGCGGGKDFRVFGDAKELPVK